jgi:hypothetical protein
MFRLRSDKVVGTIRWAFVILALLAPVIAYLIKNPDFSQFINYLSDIRVTPAWPQIGLFPTPAH